MGRERHGALEAGIPVLFFVVLFLAWPGLQIPALAAHFDNAVSNLGSICYDCHTLNSALADNNTSFINASSRTLPTMRSLNGGVSPGKYSPGARKFGCTYCHNDPTRTTNMKTAIGPFDSRPSQHPVDRGYTKDAFANITLTANTYTTLYLSNWDNTWTRPANQLDCVDCHDAGASGGSYPNHPVPGTGTRASGVNPFMLKNTPASETGGHAPDSFCLVTCHAGTAPGTAAYAMGHYGWGAYRSTTGGMPDNTLKEHDGTPLKTSKCVDCHETHSTTSNPNLMGERKQSILGVDPANCTNVCHYGAPTDNAPFTAKGHGKTGINLLCANCHNASVNHRDTVNPRRLIGTVDPAWATLTQALASNGLDDDFDGQVDNPTENSVRYSAESTCTATCHTDKHLHSGSITTASGPVTGSASCLHCHEPHAKGVGANIMMVRNKVMGNPITYQTSKADYYRSDNTSVCDNPNCHAKRLGNSTTPGTILYDIPDHRLANIGAGSDCSGCHSHSSTTGASSFSRNCNSCHTYPGQAVASGSHVLSSIHDKHVNPDSLGGYAFSCSTCHYLNTHNQSGVTGPSDWGTKFVATNVNIRFDNTWNPRNANGPKYAGVSAGSTDNGAPGVGGTGGCDGLYCHGNSSDAVLWSGDTATGPKWDNTVPAGCGTCHKATSANPPTSFAHARHADNTAGYAISCGTCHYATTRDGRTILSRSEHLNRQSRVSFDTSDPRVASGAYGGTLTVGDGGTDNNAKCSNIYCHSPGYRMAAPFDNGALGTPNWNQGPLACNACHGSFANASGAPAYPNGTPKINSHPRHVSMGYGCRACHVNTTSTDNTITNRVNHGNGTYDVSPDNAAHNFTTPYVSPNCANVACHGNNAAVWGGTAPQCGVCHLGAADTDQYLTNSDTWFSNDNAAILDSVEWTYSGHGRSGSAYVPSGNPAADFPGGAGTGDPCAYCHDPGVLHRLAGNPFRLRDQTGLSGYANAGWNATCLVCHSKTQNPPGFTTPGGFSRVGAVNDRVDTAHFGAKHGTDNTAGGKFCWDCHDGHGDGRDVSTGPVYMLQKNALAKSDGVYGYRGTAGEVTATVTFQSDNTVASGGDWARPDFRGLCQVCHHGTGAGSSTQAKYYTQSAFQSHNQSLPCLQCHDHNKNFGATCTSCHGDVAGGGGAPPSAPYQSHPWASRSTVDNASVPAGIGNHRTVPAAGIDNSSHESFACQECHTATPGTDAAHDTGKDNATLTQIPALHGWNWAGGPLAASASYGALAGGASGGSVTDDGCSNIDCHSPRYNGNAARSGSPAPYTRYWINSTQWDCYACHGFDGTTATARPGGAAAARIATGSHTRHVAGPVSLACTACHVNNGTNVKHKSGGVDFSFPAFGPYASTRSYSRNGAVPTDNASVYGTCANLYCHSIVQTATGGGLADNNVSQYKTATWGNPASGQCGACHGNDPNTAGGTGGMMASGSHQKHIDNAAQYRFACVLCHYGAGEGSSRHANGAIEVVISGALPFGSATGTYGGDNVPGNSNPGKCTASYCHGTGAPPLTGGVNQVAADNATWGTPSTGSCGTCHGAPGGAAKGASDYPASGAHARHLADNAIGPNPSLSCSDCHTSETLSTHVNGRVDFRTAWDNAAATDKAGTNVCNPCHGSGVATAKGNWDSVAAVDCLTCHGSTAAYTFANGTGRMAPTVDNGAYGANTGGHNRSTGSYTGSGNPAANNPLGKTACTVCHKTSLLHINNVDDNTYSGNRLSDNVNGATGLATISALCAACHTNTGSATAANNKANTHGNTSAAFKAKSTHDNNAQDFAYNCDACHDAHGMTNNGRAGNSYNILMIKPLLEVRNFSTGSDTTPDNTTTVGPVYFEALTGTNSYDDGATSPNTRRLCIACHVSAQRPGNTTALTNPTGDGTHVNLSDYTANEQGKDCSSCHNHDVDDNTATVDGLMPQQCNGCHSYPGLDNSSALYPNQRQMSVGHWQHAGKPLTGGTDNSRAFPCGVCHLNYAHNQSNVTAGGSWATFTPGNVNIRFDPARNPVNGNGPKYNGANAGSTDNAVGNGGTGVCAGLYCHGNNATLNTGWNGSAPTPRWDNVGGAPCGACHDTGASDTTPATRYSTGNHPVHLDNASRAYGPETSQFSAGGNCAEGTGCHTKYGLTPNDSHVNGTVDFRTSLSAATPTTLALTQVCQNCHSTYANAGNNLPSSGDTLVRTKANWDNGTYQVPCITCHNDSALAVPQGQGTVRMDGSGNKAPNILAAYYGNGHGASSIDNASTSAAPPIPCMTCHFEQGGHIGAGKTAANPWRLDNALTKYAVAGGLDNYCMTACHANAAPAKHAWIVNGVGASGKDNMIRQTHPVSTEAVPQAGAPPAETLDKSRWFQVPPDTLMPLGGTSASPASGDLNSEPIPSRLPTSYGRLVMCVTCHDPHGVGTAPIVPRTFSGTNDNGFRMLRYKPSGVVPTPLCAKCHK